LPLEQAVMATVTTIPVNIAADAAEHARKLGLQREFEMMLDKLKEIIPELRAIDVSLEYPPDYDDDPMILFSTYQPNYTGPGLDPTNEAWIQWLIKSFGADVNRHFVRLPFYESGNGR
jgi:hypothetical protein